MSYCRWSSDDFHSDIYCYQSYDDIYVIHVASNKVIGDVPHIPNINEVTSEEWCDAYKRQMEFMKTAKREPIDLPHDGQTFWDESIEDFKKRLLYLREVGYHVPEDALERIKEEMEEIK